MFFAAYSYLLALGAATIICINNSNNSCPECNVNARTSNLSQYLKGESGPFDIRLCSSQIILEGPIRLQDVHSICIESYGEMSMISCKAEQKFIIEFNNVSNMTLRNLKIEGCGGEHNTTSILSKQK
jgi:hypothetical protein